MRVSRIYHPAPLTANQIVTLSDDACHHLRVVRANINDEIELFDGSNHIYQAKLIDITKKSMKAKLESCQMQNRESPLHLHLGQVISRGEKMEFTIQKSVELGINIITPLLSERCGVKMDQQRFDKKLQQWQKIAISACEQCGRNRIPEIRPIHSLQQWCEDGQHEPDTLKLNLHPRAQKQIKHLELKTPKIRLLIGPEGGLSHDEIQLTEQYAFTDILLGPRVLRTETAALTALTALQVYFGDLG